MAQIAQGTAANLTATEMLAAFDSGELSPVEATRDVLRRIDELDSETNAFCLVDPDAALESARAAEQRRREDRPCGRLDGVPASIKDIVLSRGWPTRKGSRTISAEGPWQEDGSTTARVREHGAVLVGKTTTPEFTWKAVTDSPLSGVTRNPWDTNRTPGGSSGGAAAAVALGMAPLATGTDGGGSLRIPASFCGVFTLKPTYGLIPHYPPSAFGTLAHAGPITATVTESALMLDVLTEPDSRDWSALAPPTGSFLERLGTGVSGMRIAYSPDLGFARVDPEVAERVAAAVRKFEELGAQVEQVDPGFADPREEFHTLWFSGVAKALEHLSAAQRELLDPELHEIRALGERYSALDYLSAVNTRMRLGQRMGAFHETYDLLLTPSVAVPPFEADREVPAGSGQTRWTEWASLSYPFNMTQQPAASVPCGFTGEGLPVGLQIVGPRHADARVLAAARAFEQAQPGRGSRPPLLG